MIHYIRDYGGNTFKDSDGAWDAYNLRTPLCVNTFRLDLYRSDWDIQKILVFEAFIVLSLKYGNNFYYQQKRFIENFRIKEHTFRKCKNELIEASFLTIHRANKENFHRNFYRVNYDNIINQIDMIYDFSVFENDVTETSLRDAFKDIFKFYKDKIKTDLTSPMPSKIETENYWIDL